MSKNQKARHICLAPDCSRVTLPSERLCALCYYKLPRETRQDLAIQDERTEIRQARLVVYVSGGQPLEHIRI